MKMRLYRLIRISMAAGLLALGSSALQGLFAQQPKKNSSATSAEFQFFETKVRPILVKRCYECHGPKSDHEAGLRVDSLKSLLEGGDSGPSIILGKPQESLLIDAVNYGDVYQMPPKSKMPKEEIAILIRWVKMGAPWPDSQLPADFMVKKDKKKYEYTEKEKSYWAFQPPKKGTLPTVKETSWPKSSIDRFVLAQLETKGLKHAPPADRRTLIRRATFDLHGLPPTPEEIKDFLADDSPGAFERVVDRLLNSPRYGERWGRHWLDVARYADSNGSDNNRIFAHAYHYRDYVIRSFNDDKPFNRFVIEQLAGDLLPAKDRQTRNEQCIATGFLALGPKPLLKNDNELAEMDVVNEQIDSVGRSLMALTFVCCRCHDHKFDPLPMTDYYALAGIFKSTRSIDRYDLMIHRSWTERALGSDDQERLHRKLKKEYDYANDQRRLNVDKPKEFEHFMGEMKRLRKELAKIPVTVAVAEGDVADCKLHLRGNPQTLGDPVPRHFPVILAGENQTPIRAEHSGRLHLARWLVSENHPLTSRVIVNRIWKWHFGEGIVRSTENFGRLGQRPDNQPLLDWLAVQFVKEKWSFKAMHRLLMLSSAYQMSSHYDPIAAAADPENRLLWRFHPRRLEAEEIRDAMLAVSGQLDLSAGGPPLPPITNYELAEQKSQVKRRVHDAYNSQRRSVYLPIIRSSLYGLFKVFDFADPSIATGSRGSTTVAPQALFMMNSEFMWDVTEAAANDLLKSENHENKDRIVAFYERALMRVPQDSEIQSATQFLAQYKRQLIRKGLNPDQARKLAWQGLCRAIFSSNEFSYIE